MSGVVGTSGPQTLFPFLTCVAKCISKPLQVCGYHSHCVALPKRRTSFLSVNPPDLSTKPLFWSMQCRSHHRFTRTSTMFDTVRAELQPVYIKVPPDKTLQMIRKQQLRRGWSSGEWCHPLCSLLLITREKGGLGLLNTHGNEMWGKPRIY